MTDLAEIVYALAALQGVDHEAFERLRLGKRARRGGFERRILLVEADR